MIPIRQTNPGGRGNCMAACIASILEIPIEDLPDYRAIEAAGGPWLNAINTALSKHWAKLYVETEWHLTPHIRPRGFHLVNGGGHSVVGLEGVIVWDPTGSGGPSLRRIDNYGLLVDLTEELVKTWAPTWDDCVCRHCARDRWSRTLILPPYEMVGP